MTLLEENIIRALRTLNRKWNPKVRWLLNKAMYFEHRNDPVKAHVHYKTLCGIILKVVQETGLVDVSSVKTVEK